MVNQDIQPSEIADSLNSYLERLLADQEKTENEIKRVRSQLAGLNGGVDPESPTTRRRSPRGANKEKIKRVLKENANKRFSVGELADLVQLQSSSVRYVLKQLSKEEIAQEITTGYWQYMPRFTND